MVKMNESVNPIDSNFIQFRPQILLLSGDTFVRPSLVDFAYQIVQGVGLMVCGNITQAKLHQKSRESLLKRNNDWLRTRGIKAFYSVIDEESFGSGAKSLIQVSHFIVTTNLHQVHSSIESNSFIISSWRPRKRNES